MAGGEKSRFYLKLHTNCHYSDDHYHHDHDHDNIGKTLCAKTKEDTIKNKNSYESALGYI